MSEQVTRRSVPYPGAGALVFVPSEIWRRTLEIIRIYGRRRSEGLVHWGGVVSGSTLQVTGLYVPRHAAQGYRVRLTPEESRSFVRRLRERDEKLVAQVHSHPGAAFHSEGDDEGATSFHEGFLSIVVPFFGHRTSAISDCAVYEYSGGMFCELEAEAACRRFRFLPIEEANRI